VSITSGPNANKSTTTDASGRYAFTGLVFPTGLTNFTVAADNYLPLNEGVTGLTSTLNFVLRSAPPTIVLTGQVTDGTTSAPIAGATVFINGRYQGTTDGSGHYSLTGLLDAGGSSGSSDVTRVSAMNYEWDYHYIRGTIQNVRLYQIQQITAGDSKVVTVAPDDTLCVNDLEDTPEWGDSCVCRSVRVVAPSAGLLTVEALSVQDGTHPPVEVQTMGIVPFIARMGDPTSIQVTAGTQVLVMVEISSGSTTSQSFVVHTSISPQ
jgi:hypothetical protein